MAKQTKGGLGRGLNSLLGGSFEEGAPAPAPARVVVNESVKEEKKETPVAPAPAKAKPEKKSTEKPPVIEQEDSVVVEDNVTIKSVTSRESTRESRSEGTKKEDTAPKSENIPTPRTTDEVPLESISPNPNQPRTNFKKDELEELASSIKRDGLLQPILVREISRGKYQIIAGERRWQACKMLGMKKVPVRIKNASDEKVLELALIENIQRSDLNPIEEAYGYRRIMEHQNLTQADLAQKLSKGRSTIANALRLLDLPEDAQQLLFEEKITAGHARAILSVSTKEDRQKLTEKLVKEKLSVRETEAIARLLNAKQDTSTAKPRPVTPQSFKKVARQLREKLNTNVKVKSSQGKNKIEIEFKDEEELQKLFEKLNA